MIRKMADELLGSVAIKSTFVTCDSARVECNDEAPRWVRHQQPAGVDWIVANNWTADDVNP